MPNEETKIFQTNNTDEKIKELQKNYDNLYAKYSELNDKSEELELGIMDKHIRVNTITASKLNITNVADIGNIILGNTGYIRTTNKDNYANVTSGFWLGYDIDKYKLNIGDATHYLKWTGGNLEIKGKLILGGSGTNDEIYFKDSEVYFYDYHSTDYQRMAFKYGTLDFTIFYYYSGAAKQTGLTLKTPNVATNLFIYEDGKYFKIDINNGVGAFSVFDNGTVRLKPLSGDPTADLVAGQLAMVNNVLRFYNGSAWANV